MRDLMYKWELTAGFGSKKGEEYGELIQTQGERHNCKD